VVCSEEKSVAQTAYHLLQNSIDQVVCGITNDLRDAMKTMPSDSDISSNCRFHQGGGRWRFAEPVLAIGVALFWLVALPFGAALLALVKVWDTCIALLTGHAIRPNPLILRIGPAQSSAAESSPQAARA
jgi:hypothetical protein